MNQMIVEQATGWSPERLVRLKELALQGLSAGQMAAQLGVSRNAVIGKCLREKIKLGGGLPLEGNLRTLGLRGGGNAAARYKPKEKFVTVRSLTMISSAPVKKAEERAEAYLTSPGRRGAFDPAHASEAARLLSLVELERGDCKWPLFEDGPMVFCGIRVKTFDKDGQPSVYCQHHMAMSLPRQS